MGIFSFFKKQKKEGRTVDYFYFKTDGKGGQDRNGYNEWQAEKARKAAAEFAAMTQEEKDRYGLGDSGYPKGYRGA